MQLYQLPLCTLTAKTETRELLYVCGASAESHINSFTTVAALKVILYLVIKRKKNEMKFAEFGSRNPQTTNFTQYQI